MKDNTDYTRMNLHNHSLFSDGCFPVSTLIEYGVQAGLTMLGICDHAGTMKTPSLPLSRLGSYTRVLRILANRYKEQIRVFAGIEIDSSINRTPELHGLPYHLINQLDYILFEYISNPYWNGISLQQLGFIRRKIGIPVGLAHPDIDLLLKETPEDQLLDFLEKHCVFLELSGRKPSGYRDFPEFFNKIRGRNIRLSIGTDTHYSLDDLKALQDPHDFIESMQLENNLVSPHMFNTVSASKT